VGLMLRDQHGRTAPVDPGVYLVSRRKVTGPLTHYGVLATGFSGFTDEVIDLTEAGVRLQTVANFSAGLEVSVHRGKPPTEAHEVIARAREVLQGRPGYDALGFNCEHLATYVLDGKAASGQVAFGVIIGVLVLATFLARE
jgi:hypothetical protein